MDERVFYPSGDGVQLCALLHEPDGPARGTVVLAHGITVDKDESSGESGVGAFVELTDALRQRGYNVLRFDFRGHGESGEPSERITVSGERLDLAASIAYAENRWSMPPALVAASFGAVSAVMVAAERDDLPCLALWNPVLDFAKTFWEPVAPGGQAPFDPEDLAHLDERGYVVWRGLDFHVGKPLIREMEQIKPFEHMERIRCPVLTLHGDRDTRVSYDLAKKYARCNEESRFVTVPGAEHGFTAPADRRFVIPRTVEWIERFTR